ncbi:MAG: Wzz/FepE/Etk N-terminal domain-containing protein [Caulobacteraceae bacterium]
MNILQFLRIFWARRLIILAATLSCLVGAYIVTQLLPARWEAHSRVMLNLMKPDPVTGQIVGGQEARTFVSTQIELITDYSVAGQVADQLGWMSDPTLIAQYQKRPKSDTRDYRRWLAQLVIDNTKARLIQDSNILEITYTGTSAENAKAVADALRKSYIDTSLAFKREDAQRNAEWFSGQAVKAKQALDVAQTIEANYERANGVFMQNDKIDSDTARLQALNMQASGLSAPMLAGGPGQAATELAQIDAALAVASKSLGPNHPDIVAMRARRAAVASAAAQERRGGVAESGAGALDRLLANQKSRVIANSDKIGKLNQLQFDVDLKRDQYNRASAKVAQYQEEAAVGDAGLTPLGNAVAPKAPSFPNYWLIVPGSLLLGFAVGILVALLMELVARRVRGVEDLQGAIDAPVIGVVAAPATPRTAGRPRFGIRMPDIKWPSRRGMARA